MASLGTSASCSPGSLKEHDASHLRCMESERTRASLPPTLRESAVTHKGSHCSEDQPPSSCGILVWFRGQSTEATSSGVLSSHPARSIRMAEKEGRDYELKFQEKDSPQLPSGHLMACAPHPSPRHPVLGLEMRTQPRAIPRAELCSEPTFSNSKTSVLAAPLSCHRYPPQPFFLHDKHR